MLVSKHVTTTNSFIITITKYNKKHSGSLENCCDNELITKMTCVVVATSTKCRIECGYGLRNGVKGHGHRTVTVNSQCLVKQIYVFFLN